jgi:amino acid transporter
MTVSTPAPSAPPGRSEAGSKGLRKGALGLLASVVIGIASTAPAYSLAASLGYVSSEVGVKAPLIMLLAFVPILFISYAFKALNSRIPDCGTNFTWGARAFGPHTGWMSGWAAIVAQIIVLANLAQIAGIYTFLIFGLNDLADNVLAVAGVGTVWLIAMTYIAYRGIELSARIQMGLLAIEMVVLLIFAVLAFGAVFTDNAAEGAEPISLSWFNPFQDLTWSALSAGVLVAIFAYWGWDTAVSTNEETENSAVTPGRSAVISTLLLVTTYVLVTMAAVAYAGVGTEGVGLNNPESIDDPLSPISDAVLGHTFGKILLLAVISSSAASAQTTILPAARSTLSMAVNRALPDRFGHVHPRFQTPSFSTWTVGIVSAIFFVLLSTLNEGVLLTDVIGALGFLIAFYYGMTGLASAWFFRREAGSPKEMLQKIILPLLGGVMLFAAFFTTGYQLYTGESETNLFGVAGAFVMGIGSLVLGIVFMVIWNILRPAYFRGEYVPGSEVEAQP